jgi:hypothetical protein
MSGHGTETQAGRSAESPQEAFAAAAIGGGCCSAPAQAGGRDVAAGAQAAPCCGTALEATAAGSCCGSAAKAEAVASGAGCCG